MQGRDFMEYMHSGVGGLVPSSSINKNGTKVPAPRVKNNINGTEVPAPRMHENGVGVSTPFFSFQYNNRTKVPAPMKMIGQ